MNYRDYLTSLDEMERGKTAYSTSTVAPTSSGSSTITSRELELPDSGGGGGMGMMDSFTNLGDKIQKNSMATMQMFYDWQKEDADRRRQAIQDAEAKRQFNENMNLSQRGVNLNAMDYLAGIRNSAQQRASRRLPFRSAVGSLVR